MKLHYLQGTNKYVITDYSELPFDRAKAQWEGINDILGGSGYSEKFTIVTGENMAMLRAGLPKDASSSRYGCYIKEGILYRRGGKPIIVRSSPLLENAQEATAFHDTKREFYPDYFDEQCAIASGSSEIAHSPLPVPTNRFGEDVLARFLFGEQAGDYGRFLADSNITEWPVGLVQESYVNDAGIHGGKTFARQLWLGNISQGSLLNGDTGINFDCRLRAMLVTENPDKIMESLGK